ncbi:hypothetical protein FOZ60_000265 [Perkinsus olseni]|uniref:Transmembrane protein n=1 Tax=Perkinsus olseni TaxID=32597 RepID=A0A7J6P3S2_PEROL|nr:hypothetical protein FOZ60_000265 [Perkinsus olseni]
MAASTERTIPARADDASEAPQSQERASEGTYDHTRKRKARKWWRTVKNVVVPAVINVLCVLVTHLTRRGRYLPPLRPFQQADLKLFNFPCCSFAKAICSKSSLEPSFKEGCWCCATIQILLGSLLDTCQTCFCKHADFSWGRKGLLGRIVSTAPAWFSQSEEMSDASSETTEVDEGVEAVWQAVGETLRSLGTGSDQLPGYGRRFPGCTARPLGQLFSFPNLKKAEGSLSAKEQEEFCRRHAQVTEHLLSMLVNATRAQEKALAQLKGAQKYEPSGEDVGGSGEEWRELPLGRIVKSLQRRVFWGVKQSGQSVSELSDLRRPGGTGSSRKFLDWYLDALLDSCGPQESSEKDIGDDVEALREREGATWGPQELRTLRRCLTQGVDHMPTEERALEVLTKAAELRG